MRSDLDDDHDRLVRVETKLDTLLQRLDPMLQDHESRIRKLEQKVWVACGAAIAGGGAAGTVASFLIGL
ncbi:hypothetical protein ACFQE5_22395 [Pseudonocardia hispaniensis]|uniref:Hemolysin XhlA n=1 Tax=Pseudonocardia hispaniensis TaxID=904933 RepID=A0ABW1J9E2_9PSEU